MGNGSGPTVTAFCHNSPRSGGFHARSHSFECSGSARCNRRGQNPPRRDECGADPLRRTGRSPAAALSRVHDRRRRVGGEDRGVPDRLLVGVDRRGLVEGGSGAAEDPRPRRPAGRRPGAMPVADRSARWRAPDPRRPAGLRVASALPADRRDFAAVVVAAAAARRRQSVLRPRCVIDTHPFDPVAPRSDVNYMGVVQRFVHETVEQDITNGRIGPEVLRIVERPDARLPEPERPGPARPAGRTGSPAVVMAGGVEGVPRAGTAEPRVADPDGLARVHPSDPDAAGGAHPQQQVLADGGARASSEGRTGAGPGGPGGRPSGCRRPTWRRSRNAGPQDYGPNRDRTCGVTIGAAPSGTSVTSVSEEAV